MDSVRVLQTQNCVDGMEGTVLVSRIKSFFWSNIQITDSFCYHVEYLEKLLTHCIQIAQWNNRF